jgi:hypothetical protein
MISVQPGQVLTGHTDARSHGTVKSVTNHYLMNRCGFGVLLAS